MPTAEIIAAGTELTSGQKLDTNSRWLATQLGDAGIDVRFHTTVGDSLEDNLLAVKTAVERCDVVLMTGGLGPTLDDITRDVIAEILGEPLVVDEDAMATLESFFQGRGRKMPERNRKQAMRPASATSLLNPYGTAPGVLATVSRGDNETAIVAAMPGVPSEMRPMFTQQVKPRLPATSQVQLLKLVHCYGLGESGVEEMLGDLTSRGRNPEVGITASSATITLRILARGDSLEACEELAATDEARIRETLGKYVFGDENDTLESVVVERLSETSKTVATAESGTGGVIANLLANVPRHADVYLGGMTVPAAGDDELLGEPPPEDPFSAERAKHLAVTIRQRLKADYGLAAVCDPMHLADTATERGAMAHVAVATASGVGSVPITLLGNPAIHAARISKTALNKLRMEELT